MLLAKDTLLKLQNGSDVRGVAVAGVAEQPVTLTGDAVDVIAQAFAIWLGARTHKPLSSLKIAVGTDSRISATALKTQALCGITAQGVTAIDCGLASTPSMFMSVVFPETAYDGSIMITASHLPYNRNGLKFFTIDGGLEHADITALLTLAATQQPTVAATPVVAQFDILSLYATSLCEKICAGVSAPDYNHPLTGLKIAVDAGNGAGGFFVDRVLLPLGADASGSCFLEPDGMFPNHIPNPENKAAMDAIRTATLNSGSDLGIIFDTDVDRMSAVLQDGTEVSRDAIIAMMAAIVAKDCPGATIVTDSVTSDKLTAFLETTLGLQHHRFRRGYKNVINEAQRLCATGVNAPLAIETSGHGALRENYFLDDGAYLAVKLLIAAANAKKEGKRVDALLAALEPQFASAEYRLRIIPADFHAYGEQVLVQFEQQARAAGYVVAPNSYEGVRLTFSQGAVRGWLLLRVSLHDPLMPLNLEGDRPGDLEQLLAVAQELLARCDGLDLSTLHNLQ